MALTFLPAAGVLASDGSRQQYAYVIDASVCVCSCLKLCAGLTRSLARVYGMSYPLTEIFSVSPSRRTLQVADGRNRVITRTHMHLGNPRRQPCDAAQGNNRGTESAGHTDGSDSMRTAPRTRPPDARPGENAGMRERRGARDGASADSVAVRAISRVAVQPCKKRCAVQSLTPATSCPCRGLRCQPSEIRPTAQATRRNAPSCTHERHTSTSTPTREGRGD
ncbi:hypothetical protein C8Q80DRAFT_787995 [Daedaleopsis nitida]|nr:hypothetical protein C8Q80DRAFT_787995 [Daedaleopsis nitida]